MTQSSSAPADGSFDAVVIGAGTGGYPAAFRLAQLGLRVATIERQWVGGVCLNVGCIPSKALLHNAHVLRLFHESAAFGIQAGEVKADYGAAVDRSRKVSEKHVRGLESLFRKNKVELIRGEAKILSRDTVTVDGRQLKTKNIVVATGARPRAFPGMEVDGERVVVSWQAVVDRGQPGSAVIIGAGAIGCELATVWHAYGAKVHILEVLPHLLPREDERISTLLERSFKRQGIEFTTGVEVVSAKREGDKARVVYRKDGQEQTVEVDRCLVAPGVQANTEGFGLEQLGVTLDRGFIKVDERMATNVPGVYAVGDVVAKPLALAHVATAEGIQAAHAITGHQVRPLNYNNMPRPTFCYPQVASIGLTEAQAKQAGYEVKIGEFPFSALGKASAENESEGVVKLVADAKYGEILGCHIIGAEATEILSQITPYKVLEGTTRELAETVVSHPTLAEGVHEAGLIVVGEALHV